MRRSVCILGILALGAAITGCQTTRGVHTVPTTRDYQQLEESQIDEAKLLVEKAHRMGAQHYATFDYFVAEQYLAMAYQSKHENDRQGMWDYSALASRHAESAIAMAKLPDKGPMNMPSSQEECAEVFNRLKARYSELDAAKAKLVAPVLYAHVTASLSRAEHEIIEPRQWPAGARLLANVGPDIDTIWAQDVDDDGIVDMKDGAPWAPEDKDGFEDDDGIPDLDNDRDGIRDFNDVKINDPETANRWHDFDGAPDQYPILEKLHFASGSATLSGEQKGYLRGVAHLVAEWPEIKLHIAGHTDIRHSEPYNVDLSQRRAERVRDYLVQHGANANQLVVTFHGEAQPIADNNTASGQAMNRRVELMFE